jgi:hypothetical protein
VPFVLLVFFVIWRPNPGHALRADALICRCMHLAVRRDVRSTVTMLAILLVVATASAQQSTISAALPFSASTVVPEANEARAIEEMLRGPGGRERRWDGQPSLVVITSVLQFEGVLQQDYPVLSETLTRRDSEELALDLTSALGTLTGGRFLSFSGIWYEDGTPGTRMDVMREGQIVVARFSGVQEALDGVGYSGRTTLPDGRISSAVVMLDSDYDQTAMRRLLRTHELGHALGYNHVESMRSVMNPTLGSEPTDFDRRAALIAFRR